jgi:hypothetical protein
MLSNTQKTRIPQEAASIAGVEAADVSGHLRY